MIVVLVLFSVVAALGLLSVVGEIVMRVRLTKRAPPSEKPFGVWWRRGGDDVVAMYEDLFPGTRLPLLRRLAFWLVLALSAVFLAVHLWK